MWCYEIKNKSTGERTMIFGYSYKDAFNKAHLVYSEWFCICSDYID